ncbi:MAG: four helix bundle protein [Cocleimonas sp.]
MSDNFSTWRTPIQRDADQLLLFIEQTVRTFPRYHKYTLGHELRTQAMKIVRLIQRAMHDKKNQQDMIYRLVFAVDDIKLQIRLAKELQAFAHFGQFETAAELAVSVGKQAGGWLKRNK